MSNPHAWRRIQFCWNRTLRQQQALYTLVLNNREQPQVIGGYSVVFVILSFERSDCSVPCVIANNKLTKYYCCFVCLILRGAEDQAPNTMDMDTQPQGQQAAVPVFQPQVQNTHTYTSLVADKSFKVKQEKKLWFPLSTNSWSWCSFKVECVWNASGKANLSFFVSFIAISADLFFRFVHFVCEIR